MKRKAILAITFVILLCIMFFCVIVQKKNPFVEGVIIAKNERFFTVETDTQEKIVCNWSQKYDYQVISPGDRIRVYYRGEILETSPARIKNVKKIKKISLQMERKNHQITMFMNDSKEEKKDEAISCIFKRHDQKKQGAVFTESLIYFSINRYFGISAVGSEKYYFRGGSEKFL